MAESIRLALGPTNPVEAHILAWLDQDEGNSPSNVLHAPGEYSGTIKGPFARHAQTLPVAFSFEAIRGTPGLYRAKVAEPCYWMPGEPFVYQVTFSRRSPDGQAFSYKTTMGIRPLGVVGRQVRLSGHTTQWDLHAMAPGDISNLAREELQRKGALVSALTLEEAQSAAAAGASMLLDLRETAQAQAKENEGPWLRHLAQLSQCASVLGFVLPPYLAKALLHSHPWIAEQLLLVLPWPQVQDALTAELVSPRRNLCLCVPEQDYPSFRQAQQSLAKQSSDQPWYSFPYFLETSTEERGKVGRNGSGIKTERDPQAAGYFWR